MRTGMSLATAILCFSCASIVPMVAAADPWEVRREAREGARSVEIEKREAAREMRRCETRECVFREMREGQREVDRERREARYEVRRERFDDYTHYHPNGKYCRDGRHVAHLRDGYYRADRRWYRDGRYWNEYDYVNQYYGGRDRDDDDDDLLRGIAIGAAVVGVIAAIHEANDDD